MSERSLFFIDLGYVEIYEIGREMKLRTDQENMVKKAIFWQFLASQYTQLKKIVDRVQMIFYVEFLDTCYEKIRKSEEQNMVICGKKSKPLFIFISQPISKISTDLRPMRHALPLFTTRENISKFDSPYILLLQS